LEDVLLNASWKETTVNRALAAQALGNISARLGKSFQFDIIQLLAKVSATEKFDSLRLAAVRGVGLSGSYLAVDPLLNSCLDPSPLVSGLADYYLDVIANLTCSSTSQRNMSVVGPSNLQVEPFDISDDILNYMKDHVIIF